MPEWRNVSLVAAEKQKPNETRNATTTTNNNKVKLSVCYLSNSQTTLTLNGSPIFLDEIFFKST